MQLIEMYEKIRYNVVHSRFSLLKQYMRQHKLDVRNESVKDIKFQICSYKDFVKQALPEYEGSGIRNFIIRFNRT